MQLSEAEGTRFGGVARLELDLVSYMVAAPDSGKR